MNNRNTRFEIGGASFVLYFIYTLSVWLCDAFDLFCFLTDMPQVTLISRSIILIIMIGLCFGLRHKVCFRKENRMDGLFAAGALMILGFWAYKGIIPDMSLDVRNYHLLAQNPGFVSMTKEANFMPGNFQYYGFRWADRLFYLFRICLGYRMGTLFGGLIQVLIFWQVRSLLAEIYGEKLKVVRNGLKKIFKQPILPGLLLTESTLAFLITQTHDAVMQSGGYMVDLIGLPFALEALRILLVEQRQSTKREMVWFAFLCGCFFAMKMTNVVYIAPMIVAYLAKHRRKLSAGKFLTAFAAAILPASIYLIYAYVDTGNPVFPYFNTLFKSPYFGLTNFKDPRWGPQNLKELVLWPFLSALHPDYRTSEIPNQYNAGEICLWIVLVIQVILYFLNRRKANHTELLFVVVCSAYLWSASTGHIRYFILGQMLLGIVFCGYASEEFFCKKWIGIGLSVIVIAILLPQPFKYKEQVSSGKEWSWRNHADKGFVSRNLELVFTDQKGMRNEDFLDEIKVMLLSSGSNGSIARFLCPQVPIIYRGYISNSISDESIRAVWEDKFAGYIDEGGMYEVLSPVINEVNWKEYFLKLDKLGLKVKRLVWPETIFIRDHTMVFVELEKMAEGEQNQIYIANGENNSLKVPNQRIRFSADIMLTQGRGWREEEDSAVFIVATDGEKTEEIFRSDIREKTTIHIDQETDLTAFHDSVRLELYWYDYRSEDYANTWTYQCMMIRPEIDVVE